MVESEGLESGLVLCEILWKDLPKLNNEMS